MYRLCSSPSLVLVAGFALGLWGVQGAWAEEAGVPESIQIEVEAEAEEETTLIKLPGMIELEKAVHFLAPNGAPVVIAPGDYEVEPTESGLRLKQSDEEATNALLIAAEVTTHEKPLVDPEPLSLKINDDQHVVILLLPDGKALQAVGSYSGVHTRGVILPPSFWKGIVLPTVNKVGAVHPGRTLTIQGINFGSYGAVVLQLANPTIKKIRLPIERWGSFKIRAIIPENISGFMDHQAKIQVFNAKGVGGGARKVPFYAVRESIVLSQSNPAVKVTHCSPNANGNYCNKQTTSRGKSCPATFTEKAKDATIYVRHVNCDIFGKDKGSDRFEISLKNDWVFTKIAPFRYKSRESLTALEREMALALMSSDAKKHLGTSHWEPTMTWTVSFVPAQIEIGYKVTIRGPRGIPFR